MNILLQGVHPAVFERAAASTAGALVAGLWQGIALTLLTAVIFRFLPRTTATARFILWTAVFAASAALPLLHVAGSAQPFDTSSTGPLMLDSRWSYLLAGMWAAAATFRLVMLTIEARGLRQLWRTAEPLADEGLERAGLQIVLPGSGVEVCASSEVDRPSVIGFFAPRILIPRWLVPQLSDTELRHIVLHEMEHLRRHDDWLNLLQKIGLVLFPLNPAMFWIDRRLSTEREIACDDGVLARTNTPRAYASSLTSIAERRLALKNPRRMVALALGALGAGTLLRHRSDFAVRIENILSHRTSSNPALVTVLGAAVFAGAVAMMHAPKLVSFGSPSDSRETAHVAADSAPVSTRPPAHAALAPAIFQNASFHVSTHHDVVNAPRLAKAVPQPSAASIKAASPKERWNKKQQQWFVLTSFEPQTTHSRAEDLDINGLGVKDLGVNALDVNDPRVGDVVIPPSRVIVRTPDGKFFVAPYAAVPTQAGWLIVQL